MSQVVKCRGCGENVIEARTNAGPSAPMHLDVTPSADGNVDLAADGFATVISGRRVSEQKARGFALYHRHECGVPR